MSDDKELIAKLHNLANLEEFVDDALAELLSDAADALEAATRERDAALAAIERVRAIHYPFTPQLCYMNAQGGQSPMTSVHCHHCKPEGSNRVGDPDTWPCPTVAALDGAPEPGVSKDAAVLVQVRRYLERFNPGGTHAQDAMAQALENILDGAQVTWAPSDTERPPAEGSVS